MTVDHGQAHCSKPRICLFSQRHLEGHVSRCAEYEFEDVVCEVDDVDLVDPHRGAYYRYGRGLASRLARHTGITSRNLGVKTSRLARDYEVFLAVCQQPNDLFSLNALRGWKDRCQTSVCWLIELWRSDCARLRNHLKVLRQFDHVVLMYSDSVALVEEILGKPCTYLPPAIDTLGFCPYPEPPDRCIDVLSIGRRSQATHEALLKMAQEGQIFYVYDTVRSTHALHHRQHRMLIANMAKRSRYFIANAPKIDRAHIANGQCEISYRFLEGAASGTVMIGDPGDSQAFKEHLNWPDAVVRMPFGTTDVKCILTEMDSQPTRLARIRRDGITQCLLRHDWVHRWRAILTVLGLEPKQALLDRERRLQELAGHVARACGHDDASMVGG